MWCIPMRLSYNTSLPLYKQGTLVNSFVAISTAIHTINTADTLYMKDRNYLNQK